MKQFTSYIPVTDSSIVVWMGTFKEKLGQLGSAIGLAEEEVQSHQDAAQAVIDNIVKADLKKAELKEAVTAKDLVKQSNISLIRNIATRIKTLPGYTANMGRELGIVSSGQLVNPDNLKPVLTVTSSRGYVLVGFNKQGMTSLSLYSRLKGQQEWQSVGLSKTSPIVDDTPLQEAGKPEAREYRAFYFDGQEETGRASDIATIIHGG